MPYGNGTGPEGMGPGTGRKMGFCAGYDRPGSYNKSFGGRGQGFGAGCGGRGFGRSSGGRFSGPGGFRSGFAAANNGNEIDFLKLQQEALELEISAVKERIKSINDKAAEK